jgi:hypothetical protein
MALAFARISISTRRKPTSILLAVAIFALLAGLATLAQGRPVVFGVLNAIFVGTGVGLFEQYYVQNLRGRWIRNLHSLLSIFIYTFVVANPVRHRAISRIYFYTPGIRHQFRMAGCRLFCRS